MMEIVAGERVVLLELTEDRMDKCWAYLEQHARNEQEYAIFHKSGVPVAMELGPAFSLYFVLRFFVNRKIETDYARLGMYFQLGHLPVARSQQILAEEFHVTDRTVRNWFGSLETLGAIRPLGRERVRPGSARTMNVYSLGEWRHDSGQRPLELFYLDAMAGRYVRGRERN